MPEHLPTHEPLFLKSYSSRLTNLVDLLVDFVQHILNGLLQGCILALVGLGFSLVWGILNIINLAHAAFIMLAAYLTYFLWSAFGIDPFVTLPISYAVFCLKKKTNQRAPF